MDSRICSHRLLLRLQFPFENPLCPDGVSPLLILPLENQYLTPAFLLLRTRHDKIMSPQRRNMRETRHVSWDFVPLRTDMVFHRRNMHRCPTLHTRTMVPCRVLVLQHHALVLRHYVHLRVSEDRFGNNHALVVQVAMTHRVWLHRHTTFSHLNACLIPAALLHPLVLPTPSSIKMIAGAEVDSNLLLLLHLRTEVTEEVVVVMEADMALLHLRTGVTEEVVVIMEADMALLLHRPHIMTLRLDSHSPR